MKQKDKTGELLSKPVGVTRTDNDQAESTTEASQGTVTPRSASWGVASGRLSTPDLIAIQAVLEYLQDDYREYLEMSQPRSTTHIGHELQWLGLRVAGEQNQREREAYGPEEDETTAEGVASSEVER